MVLRNHVFNVMKQFGVPLVKPAVLATFGRPFPGPPPRSGIQAIEIVGRRHLARISEPVPSDQPGNR